MATILLEKIEFIDSDHKRFGKPVARHPHWGSSWFSLKEQSSDILRNYKSILTKKGSITLNIALNLIFLFKESKKKKTISSLRKLRPTHNVIFLSAFDYETNFPGNLLHLKFLLLIQDKEMKQTDL